MSNTIYLDVNAKNSKLSGTNNILNYELPDTLSLPTGTQIKCLQSIVNQQGGVGTSITIEEEIRESIIVQYYLTDSTIVYPDPFLNSETVAEQKNWSILENISEVYNGDSQMGTNAIPPDNSSYGSIPTATGGNVTSGGTEIIMPIVVPNELDENGTGIVTNNAQYFVPFMGEIEIVISTGTYNVNKLAEIITDQINGAELPNDNFQNNQTLDLENERYTGYNSNGTTLKRIQILNDAGFDKWNTLDPESRPAEWNPYRNGEAAGVYIQIPEPFKAKDSQIDGFSAVAVHPRFAKEIRQNSIQGYIGANCPNDYRVINVVRKAAYSTNPNMFIGFENAYVPGGNDTTDSAIRSYNPYTNGYAVGAADFNLKINTDGEFQIDKTHTPRYIPTYDLFGNKQENPGQEAAYIKRLCGTCNPDRRNEYPATRPTPNVEIGRGFYQTQSQPMKRTSGFMVMNWAFNTAKRLGTKPDLDGQRNDLREILPNTVVEGIDKFRTYDEWFASKKEARDAWETTFWYRLGFTYDDLQNNEFFEKQFFPLKTDRDKIDSFVVEGFTTNQRLDESSLTTSSTLVNGNSHTNNGTYQPKGAANAIPSNISGIQTFNTGDVNVPFDIYNNNAALKAQVGVTTGAYQGSIYYGAIMIPVITSGIPVSASRLPVLNNNGYMVVSSDIVEPTDIVKKNTFLGLLDIIPKSNLQNTDYIQDRNVLSHTLTNPQVIKEITIKILNPNLTNIDLEPNSAFLLAITYPQPKQTTLLSSLEYNQEEQQVASSLNQITAESIKQGEPTLPTFQQYNTVGDPVSEEQAKEKPIDESRRRIDLAKEAVKLNKKLAKATSMEERRAILNNLPEKDAPEIRQIAERIRKETTGSVRAGGGAKPPREQSGEPREESGEPREESGERRIPRRTRQARERSGGGAKPPKD